jgi:hypothetical protein
LQPRRDIGEPDRAGFQRLGERGARRDRRVLPYAGTLSRAVIALAGARGGKVSRPASREALVGLERVDARVGDRRFEP